MNSRYQIFKAIEHFSPIADYYQAKPTDIGSWTDMLKTIEFHASRQRSSDQT